MEKHGYEQVPTSLINPSQGSILIKQGKSVRINKLQFIYNDIQEDILVKKLKRKLKCLITVKEKNSSDKQFFNYTQLYKGLKYSFI